jgi:hypothetical protein
MSNSALAWEVESLRLTVFTPDVISPSSCDGWWSKVAGSDPEAVTRKPSLNLYSAHGPLDDARLQLNASPGRVDWLLVPASLEALATSLGEYSKREEGFAQRLGSWIELPPFIVNRLAIGTVLRLPTANRISGYQVLSKMLPSVKLDAGRSSDFSYQINRARSSKTVSGLGINRLSKWGTIALEISDLEGGAKTSTAHFVRLEIDVNTDKDSTRDLDKEKKLPTLYGELRALTREIATVGDIP